MYSSKQIIAVVILAVLLTAEAQLPPVYSKRRVQVRYLGLLQPSTTVASSQNLIYGQEARIRITLSATGNTDTLAQTSAILFNASSGGQMSMRLRIIPAYTSRASSGTRINCNTHTDYWQEFWGASSSQYLFGNALVTQGFVTFTVPPFPWRVCVNTVASFRNATVASAATPGRVGIKARFIIVNSTFQKMGGIYDDGSTLTWSELSNMGTSVFSTNTSVAYTWKSSSTMYTGDFAGIKIQQNGYRHALWVPDLATAPNTGDTVKLVPAGLPCTYERFNQKQYCGRNLASANGKWLTASTCYLEGSVSHGVGRVGTNRYNPFSSASYTTNWMTSSVIAAGQDLVAYFQLPAAGTYDVCFSPRQRRSWYANVTTTTAVPVWFKIFQDTASTCNVPAYKATCTPKGRLTVAANAETLVWSTPHSFPGAWGVIKLTDTSATLSNAQATSWEYSSTREFYSTAGGDQFRLVDTTKFTTDAATVNVGGNGMWLDANGNQLKILNLHQNNPSYSLQSVARITSTSSSYTYGASGDQIAVRLLGNPDLGTMLPLPASSGGGCWYYYDDNYGNPSKTLNGIPSMYTSSSSITSTSVTTTCCTGSSLTQYACGTATGTTGCKLSDTDYDGVTASADLGGDPRSQPYAWTISSSSSVSSTWAYIRFPANRRWNVCYRRAGTQNWRVISPAISGSLKYIDLNPSLRKFNMTYHVNDTTAGTWGPIAVRDPLGKLTTLNSNYMYGTSTSAGPDPTVSGSALKIVQYWRSCYTEPGETETSSIKPGLRECDIGYCGGSTTCAGCTGSSDDTSTARYEITFYVRMPTMQTASYAYYRVCFKNLDQSWIQLTDPKYIKNPGTVSSPLRFNTRAPPTMDFTLLDNRQGTWGKFLFRRLSNLGTQPFTIDPNNQFGNGDVVRLVPNRTSYPSILAHCDTVWGATSSSGAELVLQNFDPTKANWNLGLWCITTSYSTTTAVTSRCTLSKLQISDSVSGDVGNYPYANLDSTADGHRVSDPTNEGALAFLYLPAPNPLANYRLCYRPMASNWIEVPRIETSGVPNPVWIASPPTHVAGVYNANGAANPIYAGQYGYVRISGATIFLDLDLVKLVLASSGQCDRPAAGQQSLGNSYASFSWRKYLSGTWTEAARGGQALVADSAPSTTGTSLGLSTLPSGGVASTSSAGRGNTTAARAYFTFPTVSTMTYTSTSYIICYMTRSSGSDDTRNWQNLGTVSVQSLGIGYTAEVQPYNQAVIGIRFLTAGTILFNTQPQSDAAKIVSITSPCYGLEWASSNLPSGVSSNHVGQEVQANVTGTTNATLLTNGIDSLGPAPLASTSMSRFDVTLPFVAAGSQTAYRVCYRPAGMPYMELGQVPLASQVYPLGTNALLTTEPGVGTYSVASNILGQTPYSGATYTTGVAYTAGFIAGVATTSVASSTSATGYFTLQFNIDWTLNYATDTFKLVQYASEPVKGTYTTIPGVNCKSTGVLTTNPGLGSVASTGKATVAAFSTNMPAISGKYLLCYQKTGSNVWLQLQAGGASPVNPFYVFQTSLGFQYGSGNFTIYDYFRFTYGTPSAEYAFGAVSSADQIYVINQTDWCGSNTTLTSVAPFLYGTSNISETAAVTAPTAANYYKVCYKRTSTTVPATTTSNGFVPVTPTGWYQVPNIGSPSAGNGGNTPFYITTKPNRLKIMSGCPRYNLTYPLRTGTPLSITVGVLDTLGNALPFTVNTWANLITAVSASSSSTFSMQNTQGTCTPQTAPVYGWDMFNLRQWTQNGQVMFSLAIISACPSGGCQFTFSASDGISGPGNSATNEVPYCTVVVRSTPISSLQIWSGSGQSCRLGDTCSITIASLWTDGGLAHTAIDAVSVTATGLTGISVMASSTGAAVAVNGQSATSVGNFASGFATINFVFSVTSATTFTANTVVTFAFSAAGKNASATITVVHPQLTRVVIVDLYADSLQSAVTDSDKFIRPFLVPSWEPSVSPAYNYFPGVVATSVGSGTAAQGYSQLTNGPGYFLMAMQKYTAILRPVDGDGRYITNPTLLSFPSYSITITNTGNNFVGNSILAPCPSTAVTEICPSLALGGTTFSTDKQAVSFVIQNNIGCTMGSTGTGGCTLTFKFNGADLTGGVTSITTPVRSVATHLVVSCQANTSPLGTASSSCPSTNVETGLYVSVRAADGTSGAATDEYFEGTLLVLIKGGNGMTAANGINVTTVSNLQAGIVGAPVTATFTKGVATLAGITLTKPCAQGCTLQFVSDWGANVVEIPVTFTPSTVKLSCTLTTPLYQCTPDSNGLCSSVSGSFTYSTTTASSNTMALIYPTTQLCASVTAVDANGLPTLYETNWVMYWAQATGTAAVTLTDSGTAPSRVKAMVRSSVNFCFTVSPGTNSKATFSINFAAQKFTVANYWATTAGTCSLGTFTTFANHHIANVIVSKVTDTASAFSLLSAPGSSVNIFAQRPDYSTTTLVLTLTFALQDHYGSTFATSVLDPNDNSASLVVSTCTLASGGGALGSTCPINQASQIGSQSTLAVFQGTPTFVEGGAVTATMTTTPAIAVSAALSYTFQLDRWCLGCFLKFTLKTQAGASFTTYYGSTSAYNPTTIANLYMVIYNTAEGRAVAFTASTSPWNKYWQLWDSTTYPAKTVPSTSTGSVYMFASACFGTGSTCFPSDTYFQPVICDDLTAYNGANAAIAATLSGSPIQLYVLASAKQSSNGINVNTYEPACGASGTTTSDCTSSANVYSQVDILNSYSITLSVGSQTLKCSGTKPCTNDASPTPSQIVPAFGTTASGAVTAFIAGGSVFASTSFIVSGMYPSNYYALTSTGGFLAAGTGNQPSYTSPLSITASTNTTGLTVQGWTSTTSTQTYNFVFKGPRIAEKFRVLTSTNEVACTNKPTYFCHGTATGCVYDGYQKFNSLDIIAYSYAYVAGTASTIVPVKTNIPITVDVSDVNNVRSSTASGTVLVDLYSWTGCNNGGTFSVIGATNGDQLTFTNGRVTAWVSFTAPCQQCVIRFTLLPSTSQTSVYTNIYSDLNNNPGSFIKYSSAMDVRDNNAGSGTVLIATTNPALQSATLGLGDTVTVAMQAARSIGNPASGSQNLGVMDPAATGTVYAYNVIQSTGRNWNWFGNGGLLRPSTATTPLDHHEVSAAITSGTATISFTFQRTCPAPGCQVVLAYVVNNNQGSFLVKNANGNTFIVQAASSAYVLVGWRPRTVLFGTDFAVSLWHSATTTGITFGGIGTTTLSPSTSSKSIEDGSNGNGGVTYADQPFVTNRAEIHRMNVPAVANRLRFSFGSDSFRINIGTQATRLRPEVSSVLVEYTYPMTSPFPTYNTYAVDTLGSVDVTVGGYSGGTAPCFTYFPGSCPVTFSGQTVSATISFQTTAATDTSFLAGPQDNSGTVTTTNNVMRDGIAPAVQVQVSKPVRMGTPIFSVNSLSSAPSAANPQPPGLNFDVTVGTQGLIIAAVPLLTSVPVFSTLPIQVGLVKLDSSSNPSSPSYYIAVDANNMVTATLDATTCPAAATTGLSTQLFKGFGTLNITFLAAPTSSSTQCKITITAGAGSGVCTTCSKIVSVSITTTPVAQWAWVTPTMADNNNLGMGPMFGAMGRTTTLRFSLYSSSSGTSGATPVMTCDNPGTVAIETCSFAVAADISCTTKPTSISTWSKNDTLGIYWITVTWADVSAVSAAPYTCKINVVALDGNNNALTPLTGNSASPTVTVCKASGLVAVTNTTAAFRGQYLTTALPYSFQFAVVDPLGNMCRGDSGDDGSEIQASLVTNARTPAPVSFMTVFNANFTTSSPYVSWTPASLQSAKAVGGSVTFSLFFSNSTIDIGQGSVRVKAAPLKGPLATTTASAMSGSVDTVIAASMVTFSPKTPFPQNWVQGRALPPITVIAVDALQPQWGVTPNIPMRATELGNNIQVSWAVNPLPSGGFPLTFTGATSQTQPLTQGQATFSATFLSSRDGVYGLSVTTPAGSSVSPSPSIPIRFQAITGVGVLPLPNTTFTQVTNGTTTYLNSTDLNAFNVTAIVQDANSNPVVGDNTSWILVQMNKPSTSQSNVYLSIPPAYLAQSSQGFYMQVTNGMAMFSLGFVGSTMEKSGFHTPITLQFSCPATVPASIAGTAAPIANPCAASAQTTVSTMPIVVINPAVSATAFTSTAVLAVDPIIKIPTTIASLSQFNVTQMQALMAAQLSAQFPYITTGNAGSVISITACEVNRNIFGNADLGSTVCGAQGLCTGTNSNCPVGVNKCVCPGSGHLLSALLSRYLLQTTTTVNVQAEMSFNLQNAVGFSATSVGAITSAYASLASAATSVLQQPNAVTNAFQVVTTAVGQTTVGAPSVAATLPPTAPPTAAPTTAPPPAPPTGTPAPTGAASLVRASVTVLLAALLALALLL